MKGGFPRGAIPGLIGLAALAVLPLRAETIHSHPDGYGEVPLAFSTPARAQFSAKIDEHDSQVEYTLTYSGFITQVLQAHIHFGRRAVNGGIMVFLCSNLPNPPAGTPACPNFEGTVTGVLTAASVIGPTAQGIAPGEFAEFVSAIRADAAYVNIHTVANPGGEIRDQVKASARPR